MSRSAADGSLTRREPGRPGSRKSRHGVLALRVLRALELLSPLIGADSRPGQQVRRFPAFVGIGDSGRTTSLNARRADWLRRTSDDLMVPAPVLAETGYLIDRTLGRTAEAAFLDSVGMGPDYTFPADGARRFRPPADVGPRAPVRRPPARRHGCD
jgi:hypothetical protein